MGETVDRELADYLGRAGVPDGQVRRLATVPEPKAKTLDEMAAEAVPLRPVTLEAVRQDNYDRMLRLAQSGVQITPQPAPMDLVLMLCEQIFGAPGTEEYEAFELAYEQRISRALMDAESQVERARLLAPGSGVPNVRG